MPFTLAHAAAAYPFRRTRLVLSALIIGTFAPDLEFFLRFAPKGPFGHTPRGLFLFCLPVGLIVFWVFHEVVKEPVAALMPKRVRQRIDRRTYPITLRRPFELALILVSILIGAATHDLWDAFTHADRWPFRNLSFLMHSVTLPTLGVVHYYKLFQYASTLFGCIAVLLWFLHWVRTAPIQPEPAGGLVSPAHARIARAAIPAIALLGATLRTLIALGDHPASPRGVEVWVGEFVVTAISIVWLEMMAWGLTLPAPPVRSPREVPQTVSAR